eukprot:354580-Chlamydomonas_euryale.AAC.1
MAWPCSQHMSDAKHLLKYLQGTKGLGIVFGQNQEEGLQGKSSTGFVFTLNGGALAWGSQTQSVVAQSTCEAEYIAGATAAKEDLYLKQLMPEFGYDTKCTWQWTTRVLLTSFTAKRAFPVG